LDQRAEELKEPLKHFENEIKSTVDSVKSGVDTLKSGVDKLKDPLKDSLKDLDPMAASGKVKPDEPHDGE
jgi:uncharacterized phage infection (PIP) family protein YhgE